jgi:hypothetical protein
LEILLISGSAGNDKVALTVPRAGSLRFMELIIMLLRGLLIQGSLLRLVGRGREAVGSAPVLHWRLLTRKGTHVLVYYFHSRLLRVAFKTLHCQHLVIGSFFALILTNAPSVNGEVVTCCPASLQGLD